MRSIVEIPFYSDNVQAVREGEQVWVIPRRVCESLGIDAEAQRQRLRDPERCPWATTCVIQAVANDAKEREVFALDLKSLPLWLATIDAGRVKPEARFQLVAYQRECADVLARHFFGQASNGAELAELRREVAALSNNQVALWRQLAALSEQMPIGGCIPAGRFNALTADIRTLADVEVRVDKWATRRAALADIRRELSEVTAWGGKGRAWNEMPAAAEPAARALLRRRMKDATKTAKPAQLTLLKTDPARSG